MRIEVRSARYCAFCQRARLREKDKVVRSMARRGGGAHGGARQCGSSSDRRCSSMVKRCESGMMLIRCYHAAATLLLITLIDTVFRGVIRRHAVTSHY